MIARLMGKVIEKAEQSVLLENNGICYEIFLPLITLSRINEYTSSEGFLKLITYHYYQVEPSRSIPILVGFLSKLEKDFFELFITVSGIGPKAALRALNVPISSIAKAIDEADAHFLQSLPGIGTQRAKEIIAKLQGKMGRFGLIPDSCSRSHTSLKKDLTNEAIEVLMQLQYKKNEAKEMVQAALKQAPHIKSIEELLNIVYRQKISP